MAKQTYWVVGNTHIDLAWKKDRHEMAELLDIFLARLLDMLDSHPTFTYTIEQAAHYRLLAKRRPDLYERVKRYVQDGRLEIVGGMASTLETNLPHGECLVRNQMMGLLWAKENFGVDVPTAWLIDTFGLHAQLPQLLKQFGFKRLMANRFGGDKQEEVFYARGLDGTQLLVAGRDVYSPYVKAEHIHWRTSNNWEALDKLYTQAAAAEGDGPFLVTAYTENEVLPSLRSDFYMNKGNADGNEGAWQYGTLSGFFEALEEKRQDWPVLSSDLNPEFTGTFSLRIAIRMRNRAVENLLLEAEKWAALRGVKDCREELAEAWWEMAYIQFHDVFTGSHPTSVFHGVLDSLNKVERTARAVLGKALFRQKADTNTEAAADHATSILLTNGLPFPRNELIEIPVAELSEGAELVLSDQHAVSHDVVGGSLRFVAELPAMSTAVYTLKPSGTLAVSKEASFKQAQSAVIENDYMRLESDTACPIRRLIWKQSNEALIMDAKDLITVQIDRGSFQIEELSYAEVPASAGQIDLLQFQETPVGQRLLLKGSFPELPAIGGADVLTWEAELELRRNQPLLSMKVKLNWKGEGARVRLNVSSTIDSSDAICEIPFGTVVRKPYRSRATSRGEWPVQRFAAIEDSRHGLALINNGASGIETAGGRISTTLLRAPMAEYAGMWKDDTSSQHGEHAFAFALVPYCGSWSEAGIVQLAQAFNTPVHQRIDKHDTASQTATWLELDCSYVALSAVKAAEDGGGDWIVRLYEATGANRETQLYVKDAAQAWTCSIMERAEGEAIAPEDSRFKLSFRPFEIKTLRIRRKE
jgi:alpha-mannosidase